MSRRFGGVGLRRNIRGSSGGGGAATPTMYSISGWNNAGNEYYSNANNGPPAYSGAGSWSVGGLFDWSQVPTGSQTLFAHSVISSATDGWAIWTNGAVLQLTTFDAVGSKSTPTRTIVAGDVGKVNAFVATFDGSALRAYWNRAQLGTSTACGSLDVPAATMRTSVGASDNGGTDAFAATHAKIFGVFATNAAMSLAEVQAWCDACKAAYEITPPGVGTTPYLLRSSDNQGLSSPWTDTQQGEAYTRRGAVVSLVLNTHAGPTWGF